MSNKQPSWGPVTDLTVLLGWLILLTTDIAQAQPPHPFGFPRTTRNCYEIRYNPAACDCTPFEVRQGDRWSRVVLDDRSEGAMLTTAIIEASRQTPAASSYPTTWVTATVTDKVQRCTLGHPHPIVELRELCQPEPGPTLPLEPPAPPPEPSPADEAPPSLPEG